MAKILESLRENPELSLSPLLLRHALAGPVVSALVARAAKPGAIELSVTGWSRTFLHGESSWLFQFSQDFICGSLKKWVPQSSVKGLSWPTTTTQGEVPQIQQSQWKSGW